MRPKNCTDTNSYHEIKSDSNVVFTFPETLYPPHLKVKEWWMNADQTLSEHKQFFSTIEANEVQPQNLAVTVPEILYFPHMNGKQTGYKRCIFWNI